MFNRVHRLSLSNNNMIEGVDKNLLIYNRRKFERLKDMEGYIKTKSRELLIKNNENERKSFKYERVSVNFYLKRAPFRYHYSCIISN